VGKTVLKWRTRDDWRIGEHESWLRDMALGGLFLKKVGLLFYWFEKSEPRQMRYRIVPVRDIPMTLQQKKAGAPDGWDFVTSFTIFNVYSSQDEANTPELLIAPEEYAKNLNRATDRLIIGLIFFAVFVILFIKNIVDFFCNPIPNMDLLSEMPSTIISDLIFLVYALYLPLSAIISIRRLKKSLLAGNPIDHVAPWQKKRRLAITGTAAVFAILALMFWFSMTQVSVDLSLEKTLPAGENSLPIVRLADIEKNPGLVRNVGDVVSGVDSDNKILQGSCLLAPVQIKSYESGIIKTEKSKDGSGAYKPYISNEVYKLALQFMMDKILYKLMDYDKLINGDFYNGAVFRETASPYFDRLFILKTDRFFEIIAAKGRVIISVFYIGNAGSDTVIKAAAEKISLMSQ